MLRFAGLAVGQHLRRAHDPVLRFEVGQPLLVAIDASLQIGELRAEPAGGLRRGLNLRFAFLLAVGADERVDHRGRKSGVARTEANLDQKCARHGLHMEPPREAIEKPGLRVGRRLVGIETRKAAGKVAAETGRLVELEAGDHAPGEAVAAQHAGQSLKRNGRGENRRRDLLLNAIEAERRDGRSAQLDAGDCFILIGSDEAIKKASQQERTLDSGDEAAAPPDDLPQIAQRSGCSPRQCWLEDADEDSSKWTS